MAIARQLQKDLLFIAGCVLIVLGVGNSFAGAAKVTHYQAVIAAAALQARPTVPFFSRGKQQTFPSEEGERLEIARAKLDFYQVVLSSGRLMTTIGIVCTLIACIRLYRQTVTAFRKRWLSAP
ncbi:MAG: hypothetical protein NZ578_06695 [Candidatus Binatia bacterium]|nr:hypothetical protein [Candidatus Binatia bacterium]